MNPFGDMGALLRQGGPSLIILITCSILMMAVIFERLYRLRSLLIDPDWLLEQMTVYLPEKKISEAVHFCRQVPGVLPVVFEVALLRFDRPKQAIEEAMSTAITEQSHYLEKYLGVLGTMAVIAPFIGLFGTVLGIIRAFKDMAEHANANVANVSAGIAEALIATAAGLFVAILSVIFFNYFKQRIRFAISQMHIAASKLSEMVEYAKEGMPLPADLRVSRDGTAKTSRAAVMN